MPNAPAETSDVPEVALRVIANLYESVADGSPYEPMFFAMDDVIEQLLSDHNSGETLDVWSPIFEPHFKRAAHVFDIMSRSETKTPLNFVEKQRAPTAVVDATGRCIASNAGFEALLPGPWDDGIAPLFATPSDSARFFKMTRANTPDAQSILNLALPGTDQPRSFLAGSAGHLVHDKDAGQLLYLMMIQPRWSEKTGALLQQAFELTGAEIETMQNFVACGSVKGVAERRGRSIRTVRTQLSRVFAQMGISGQTELAFFLATLSGMEPISHTPIQRPNGTSLPSDKLITHQMNLRGHPVEVYEYGAPRGKPVLLLQSTHPPELTVAVRRALFHAGLRIIAPLKPGSGGSVAIKGKPGPEDMASFYAELLQKMNLGKVIVAGQASGGLYALAFADAHPARTHAVALIDTGLPFADRSEMMQLPTSIRRTMVPARYFPEVLYLPHKLVAANFRRSVRGEESVVDYFFADSPHDQDLTRTNRDAYDVTRRIISHSFEDTTRLVQDVTRWARDWTTEVSKVAHHHRLRFIHGQKNTMFHTEKIDRFVQNRADVDITPLAGGQLAIFEDPDAFSTALAELGVGL